MLKVVTIAFVFMMAITLGILVYNLSQKDTTTPVLIEDQPLKVLNRIEGIDGPALYPHERLRTSLDNCNRTDKELVVLSTGIFRKEDDNVVVIIDPTSVIRRPGCETTIRMSSGTMIDRGLMLGTWHIEGTRVAKFNGDTQTITFKSESFKVVPFR